MKIFVLLNLILILFIYAGYPLVLYVLGLFFEKKHKTGDGFEPNVTILIPAYNEENVIEEKILNTLALDYPKGHLEVLVIIDESTDRTEQIVRKFASDVQIMVQRPRRGKMAALNKASTVAQGDILLFSDANSMYRPDAVRKIVRHFYDEKVGLVCGDLRLIDEGTMIGTGESFYWKYEKYLKRMESALGQLLVVNGSIYAVRKELFYPVSETLADDFVLPMRIAKKGFMLVYEPEAVNEEKTSTVSEDEFKRKVRIVAQGMSAAFAVWPVIFGTSFLRVFEFMFHKFLRWFVFLFALLGFAFNLVVLDSFFFKATMLFQSGFYALAAAGYFLEKKQIHHRLFFVPFYFCLVNIAAYFAFVDFLCGKQNATWEKAQSTR